jgi:3-oxoacyl-[acyl-carrier-protein] synthase-3
MKPVRMVSTGSYLPGDPITNADLERLVGPLPADILQGLQVQNRHWMIDPPPESTARATPTWRPRP